mmetsp:Transcript_32250/g.32601  ORF Transcript_32250/g.32601 Transcript_32250/m.32601 type:complete len:107 (-) Transcript_32250:7-327(-)
MSCLLLRFSCCCGWEEFYLCRSGLDRIESGRFDSIRWDVMSCHVMSCEGMDSSNLVEGGKKKHERREKIDCQIFHTSETDDMTYDLASQDPKQSPLIWEGEESEFE